MKIVIAISSFKSDLKALQLIAELHRGDYDYSSIVVVCSSGGEELASLVSRAGYGNCQVLPFDTNLGSAGNLYERFKAADKLNGDFMLALNHDAKISEPMFKALINAAKNSDEKIGALYPLRYKPGKRRYDLTGMGGAFPFMFRGAANTLDVNLIEVGWSSSNGALYAIDPFRTGLAPDASLWMGWEDYLYGIRLRDAGYHQYIVSSASTIDDYEYKKISLFGMEISVSDKPLWYSYYGPRNMALICIHRCSDIKMMLSLTVWVILLSVQILLSRKGVNRFLGLGYFFLGLWHGIINKSGRWRLP